MMKILRFLLGAMLLFIIITVAAFVYLKWWQALLVVFAMIVAIVFGVKYLLRNIGNIMAKSMIKLFEVKSQVLRGAEATVHSVQPMPIPPPGESDEADAPPRDANYYRFDVTITPKPSAGPMSHWDLDDLRMVSFDTPATSLDKMSDEGDIENYPLGDVEVLDGAKFTKDHAGKYEGPQQVRATVAVPPHVRELKFQYYAEQFGRLTLPPPLPKLD